MKDADKIFFYVSLRVLRSYSIVQSESRCPPTFIYAQEQEMLWVITVYEPDIENWEADFKARRKP